MTPLVFNYSDPQQYLKEAFFEKHSRHPHFSIRAWAQQMGFKNHTSLVFFLQGKRKLRPQHAEHILKGLRVSKNEEDYFKGLIQIQSVSTLEEKDRIRNYLKLLVPPEEINYLDIERFKLVADWLHMAILEMTQLSDFQNDAEWISKRLHFVATTTEVKEAIQRLINLKLLANINGKLTKTKERLTTSTNRGTESIREHHRQVLTHAIEAIESQTVDERILNSCTMTINSKKIKQAHELILKFREDMSKLMETKDGDETYQMSVQFYKLTKQNQTINEKDQL